MPQEQVHAVRPRTSDGAERTDTDDVVDQAVADAKRRGADTLEEADAWLDSIDEALDEWAETSELAAVFVASYIQKGGQ